MSGRAAPERSGWRAMFPRQSVDIVPLGAQRRRQEVDRGACIAVSESVGRRPPQPSRSARALGTLSASCALLASLACTTPIRCAAQTWTALHFPSGGGFSHTLVVGDLDGDGDRDVAVANSVASAVRVLLGNGDGTLAPFQSYPSLGEPQDVQMADVTGDGLPELLTPDYAGSGVTVLRGLGGGAFAPPLAYPVGAGLVSLAVADLDGDGRLDVAVSKEAGSTIAVLPALATGGFGAALERASGATPHQIAAAHLDHDGHLDLVVASFGAGTVSVHLGNGSHLPDTAMAFAVGATPVGLAIADLDLDGDDDLLVSDVNAATLTVLIGHGDGTFAAAVTYPTDPRPRGLDAGDLDGDGIPEVVVATGYPDGDSALTLFRGVGDGTLTPLARFDLPYRALDCVIADMDGDGWRDIVATGPLAGVVSVLRNPGGTLEVPAARPHPVSVELRVHPNPASGPVTCRFRSPAGEATTVEVLDLLGRRVARLASSAESGAWRRADWRGDDARGSRMAPGVYVVRLTAGGATLTRRVVLLPR